MLEDGESAELFLALYRIDDGGSAERIGRPFGCMILRYSANCMDRPASSESKENDQANQTGHMSRAVSQ